MFIQKDQALPHLIRKKGPYYFWLVENENTGKLKLRVDKDGLSNYPTRRTTGSTTYWEHPERFSKEAQSIAFRILKTLEIY